MEWAERTQDAFMNPERMSTDSPMFRRVSELCWLIAEEWATARPSGNMLATLGLRWTSGEDW
jgi:hypothetical protein